MKWWDHYAERFPTLAKLARKFLCIMGTSVPSERVFSVAGLTVTKTRSRLDSEVVNEIIFMNKVLHKKFKETSTKEEIKQDPDSEQSTSVSDQSELPLPALYQIAMSKIFKYSYPKSGIIYRVLGILEMYS